MTKVTCGFSSMDQSGLDVSLGHNGYLFLTEQCRQHRPWSALCPTPQCFMVGASGGNLILSWLCVWRSWGFSGYSAGPRATVRPPDLPID